MFRSTGAGDFDSHFGIRFGNTGLVSLGKLGKGAKRFCVGATSFQAYFVVDRSFAHVYNRIQFTDFLLTSANVLLKFGRMTFSAFSCRFCLTLLLLAALGSLVASCDSGVRDIDRLFAFVCTFARFSIGFLAIRWSRNVFASNSLAAAIRIGNSLGSLAWTTFLTWWALELNARGYVVFLVLLGTFFTKDFLSVFAGVAFRTFGRSAACLGISWRRSGNAIRRAIALISDVGKNFAFWAFDF